MKNSFFNYKPSDKTKKFVKEFSKDVVNTTKNYIRNRNQTNVDKMITDHYYGKLGELAVWHYFSKTKNIEMSPPDFKITSKKSFDADLNLSEYNIHVKSQHIGQANRFGISWMLQKTDKLVSSPKDVDLFAFCIVDENDNVEILKLVYAKDIKYGEPKLDKLKNNKTVIYYEDNENILNFSHERDN